MLLIKNPIITINDLTINMNKVVMVKNISNPMQSKIKIYFEHQPNNGIETNGDYAEFVKLWNSFYEIK